MNAAIVIMASLGLGAVGMSLPQIFAPDGHYGRERSAQRRHGIATLLCGFGMLLGALAAGAAL